LPALHAVRAAGHQIVGLITKPDAPKGRGRVLEANEIAAHFIESGLPVLKPKSHSELMESLHELKPELVIAISYGRLIRKPALESTKFGWINLHFSLLPKYRGAAPVQWTILNGESSTGITIFKLDEGMDTGPILAVAERKLQGDETSGLLLNELAVLGAGKLVEAMDLVGEGVAGISQPSEGTLAPKISKEMARIEWQRPAQEIDRLIRAMNPAPMSWSTLDGERVRLIRARVSEGNGGIGEVIALNPLTIGTGMGAIIVEEIQGEGKKRMNTPDWLRGVRLNVGAKFV
jgi:methionyl-tRNA formyltransferase